MWRRCWQAIKTLVAIVIFFAVCGCVVTCKDDFLLKEARGATARWEYALHESSSQAELCTQVAVWELPFVEGESVTLCFPDSESADGYIRELMNGTGAYVIDEERCGDTENVYAYTPRLGQGLHLPQGRVNLHVARRGNTVCVGSPIIFGGY